MESDKKNTYWGIAIFILILLITKSNTSQKPYHSDVYSSWEEEQLDELRADMNYYDDQLEKLKNKLNLYDLD